MVEKKDNRGQRPRRKAFTLIELLIVVAIIAILAAIAVPNFLQAQARAGVARVMTDMRNCGIAMTRYRMDQNQWPNFNTRIDGTGSDRLGQTQIGWIMKVPGVPGQGTFTYPGDEYIGKFLTTPFPYMTSIPMDEFNSRVPAGFSFYCGDGQRCSFVMTNWGVDRSGEGGQHIYQYFMESAGPDGMWWTEITAGGRQNDKFHYDPTNGALSQGQIVYTDKGFLSPDVSGLPLYPIG